MPHPAKEQSGGHPVVIVPLLLYTDDTSANVSKKWHALNSWCFLLAGLPRHTNTSLSNIHFICCSDKATVIEMAEPMVDELRFLEDNGILCYDGNTCCNVLVFPRVMCIMCDNPRASEVLNHLGSSANKYCRMCMVSLTFISLKCMCYYN